MDIWAWVFQTQEELREAGHGRLADLIDAIPQAVIADDNAEVDAMVPEAVGLARALNLPWVEIFVRHWHLQARGGGFSVLDDAVALLEFSHRDEHRSCPQSVCTVQDLAIAYDGADGPGFAQERLDVSTETLARIDPSWPCYSCITGERASALVDAGRHEEAIEFVDRARSDMAAAGNSDQDTTTSDVNALLALGRPEEALARLREAERRNPSRDDVFSRHRRGRRARALLALGRAAEAKDALLPLDLVLREPAYAMDWAEAVGGLADAGEHDNDWRSGSALEQLLGAQVERGRAWNAVRIAAIHGRLALARGARITAEHAAEIGREQALRLRDPARGAAVLAGLEERLAAAADDGEATPETPEALLEELGADGDDPDPERNAERLAAGCRRWPDSLDLAMELSGALYALGRTADGAAALRAFAERHPDDEDAWAAAGAAAVAAHDRDALADVIERVGPIMAAWLRALMADELDDHETAAAEARRVVELDPDAMNARRLWLHAADEASDWATALEQVEALLERVPTEEAEDLHWVRLTVATPLGAWDAVRESAAKVGMELGGDSGPVAEAWGPVNLSFGPQEIEAGVRTGPATARVARIAPPGSPQRAGAVVLFDPAPLNPDAGEDEVHVVRVRAELEPSAMRSHAFDAVDPGEEAWLAFWERLEDEGWLLNSYPYAEEMELSFEGEPCRGRYGYVAVPETTTPRQVHERLTALAATLPRPLIWPALAEEAGDDDAGRAQRAVAEAVGLVPD